MTGRTGKPYTQARDCPEIFYRARSVSLGNLRQETSRKTILNLKSKYCRPRDKGGRLGAEKIEAQGPKEAPQL